MEQPSPDKHWGSDTSGAVATPIQHGEPSEIMSFEKGHAYSNVSSDPLTNGQTEPWLNLQSHRASGKHRIHWRSPAIAICLFLVGVAMAIGHHEFLYNLNNQPVNGQVWINRGSFAMAFIVKTGLAGSIGFAFEQRLWHTLEQVPKGVSVSALDSLFSAVESPLIFLSGDAWRSALIPVLMIVPLWFIPLTALVSPTALTVGTLNQITTDINCQVPFVNMSLENDVLSTGDYLSNTQAEGGYYVGPSVDAQRLVNTAAQSGEQIGWPSPCGKNCTYEMHFDAPSFQCTPSTDIDPQEAPWEVSSSERYCANPKGTTSVWFPGCGNGSNMTVQQLDSDGPGLEYSLVYAAGFNETTSRLWVGVVGDYNTSVANPNTTTVQELVDVNVFSCDIMNATYKIQVNYLDSQQFVNILQLNEFATITIPLDSDTTPFELYAVKALYNVTIGLLSGIISSSPQNGLVADTSIGLVPKLVAYTPGYGQDKYLPINDLAPFIEELSHNVSLSLLFASNLAVTTTMTTTCVTTETITVWKYKPEPLIITYSCGIAVTLVTLIVGMFSVWSTRSTKDTRFSTILRATRGKDLDRLVAEEKVTALPLSSRVEKTKLRFSNSVTGTVEGQKRGGFRIFE
ncbi:hypothetical protein G7Y89_g3935 [Cudoniella acicularis]|uniref:Uncharacterized protein n=1 Tax=Cudoniella acicularis TaxID=354080 RepID=A0A8H4RQF1_9HELO|nr:hypothetical protein G7Y89_g3935 [Cudoniella acicularis]